LEAARVDQGALGKAVHKQVQKLLSQIIREEIEAALRWGTIRNLPPCCARDGYGIHIGEIGASA
jgi:hypothetical protein